MLYYKKEHFNFSMSCLSHNTLFILFFIQHFVSSMEIGNNGYHNERSQGIPDPMMTR